ncbi:MAG: sugar phosphate isomerase/epimerase [Firmicutes bacterium]|nr:sugar phosphate isomerase/epimerase [Bacillota bacterium]
MKSNLDRLFIATFSSKAEETAKEYGFGLELNDLCISRNLEADKREWVIERMHGELERASSLDKKVIMHGPFTELTPDAIDPGAIDLMIKRYMDTISICLEMGIRDLVLHDGYIPLLYQKSWHIKRSIDFWSDFAERVPEDFTIYIENVFDDEPDTLCEIIDRVNENLKREKGRALYKICLDIGHANALTHGGTEEIIRWIKNMGMRIGHFHLHNNDGFQDLHNHVNEGTLDIETVLKEIMKFCHPDSTMTIESRDAEPSAKFLKEFFGG